MVLDFAKNAQVDKTEYDACQSRSYVRSYLPVPEMEPEAIRYKAAAELINSGGTSAWSWWGREWNWAMRSGTNCVSFIEKADMPAGCTLARTFRIAYRLIRLNKGMLGMHGNLGPNINTNKCDVLIAVGMRFDDRVTGNLATYAKQAKVIHFDIDPAEVNKNVKVDIAVLGDCKKTLAAVTGLLKQEPAHRVGR